MADHSDIDHTGLTGAGGSVATDAIFDAKGDIPVGTGANTSAKRTVGANGTVLTADSAETTGVKWATPAAAGAVFKSTTRVNNGNYTTTSTTRTAIDGTNLTYLTHSLAIGDVVRCTLHGLAKSSADGFPAYFDFEVDQPTSANVFIGAGHDSGVASVWTATRQEIHVLGIFTATEAGTHGFRPVWYAEATATATLSNASSGGDDVPIYFVVEKLGAPA